MNGRELEHMERILLTEEMVPKYHSRVFADDAVWRMFKHIAEHNGHVTEPPKIDIEPERRKVAWRVARCIWNRVLLHAQGRSETHEGCLKIRIPDWWLDLAVAQAADDLAWADWAFASHKVG